MFASSSSTLSAVSTTSYASWELELSPPMVFVDAPFTPSARISEDKRRVTFFTTSTTQFSPITVPVPVETRPQLIVVIFASTGSGLVGPKATVGSRVPYAP